ncbi:MAG: hypothetical protein ACRENO_10745 [Thermodesulfobacteriota bacterium]
MRILIAIVFSVSLFASTASAQRITDYNYNPGDALHPFKWASLAIRPPLGLLSLFIKGGYWVTDTDPIQRIFNIEYNPTIRIDEDY